MKTEVIKIDAQDIDIEKIKQAAEVIKSGGIVAFPTETVYGLAADFSNKQAVEKIYQVKKRPRNKPLTVQIHDISYLEQLCNDIPTFAYQLMSRFWPGPLTLVLRAKQASLLKRVLRRHTIGVRIPAHPIAQSLLQVSRTPLVVPSANFTGQPPAKSAKEVIQSFDGLLELVIDGGPVELGVASTVVDLTVSPYRILRAGAIKEQDIQNVLN